MALLSFSCSDSGEDRHITSTNSAHVHIGRAISNTSNARMETISQTEPRLTLEMPRPKFVCLQSGEFA